MKRAIRITTRRFAAIILTILILGPAGLAEAGQGLVIAHRGASGYLPEHTLEAYAMAYAQGADYLEPDVVLTSDGVLICSHDIHLEGTTNIEHVFPDRAGEDGHWHACDFTLHELKTVNRTYRGSDDATGFQIATLDEMLTLIASLNKRSHRTVGVIPEPKQPRYHRDEGRPIEPALVKTLTRHGYRLRTDPAIIQCFDLDSLRTIREDLGCNLRMVFLTGGAHPTNDQLDEIAEVADGIGPSRKAVEPDRTAEDRPSSLVAEAHQRGLAVFPYTFGNEPDAIARFFHLHGVDGLFTDYPDVAVAARNGRSHISFDITLTGTATADNLGAGQGAAIIDNRLYLYGDAETGVIREYDLNAARNGELKPTGRVVLLTHNGRDIIPHPTGFTHHPEHGTFIGNTVAGKGTIFMIDWNQALADGNLDHAVINIINDDLAANGCRPEFVPFEGRWLIATADYGNENNALRLYDPTALANASHTSEPAVLVDSLPCGRYVQTLHWCEDLQSLVLIQNQIAGLRYRLTFTPPTSGTLSDLRDFTPLDLPHPTDELEGFAWLGQGKCLFFSSSPRNNLHFGQLTPTFRQP